MPSRTAGWLSPMSLRSVGHSGPSPAGPAFLAMLPGSKATHGYPCPGLPPPVDRACVTGEICISPRMFWLAEKIVWSFAVANVRDCSSESSGPLPPPAQPSRIRMAVTSGVPLPVPSSEAS